jgi:hypothetical protein
VRERHDVSGQGWVIVTSRDEVKANVYFGGTHDMAAEGADLTWTRRAATQNSFTGGIGCSYTTCCHARIMQAFGSHLRGTTASVKTVDDHDIGVGRRPVGASADQVQGIQTVRFTGWRANGKIAAARVWRTANML